MDRGLFLIYVYICRGGGRTCNTLQCGCEAENPEMGTGCKATVLPTVTNFHLHRSPSQLFLPGVQAELISGFQNDKTVRTSRHNKFSRGRLGLKGGCVPVVGAGTSVADTPVRTRGEPMSGVSHWGLTQE